MVDWLISKEKARNRPEALMLATGLMNEGFLQPAGDLSKEGAEGGAQSVLLDEPDALYYFVSTSLSWRWDFASTLYVDDPPCSCYL